MVKDKSAYLKASINDYNVHLCREQKLTLLRIHIHGTRVNQPSLLDWAVVNKNIATTWVRDLCLSVMEWYNGDETIIINTSGSTGEPKSIQLSKSSMRASAQLTIDYFELEAGQKALLCLPARYIAGKMMLIRAIQADMDLYCVEPSALPLNDTHLKFDFVAMTPHQVHQTLRSHPNALDRVKTLIIGGAPVSPRLQWRLQKVSAQCYQTYGMTETITHIALQKLNGLDIQNHFEALHGVELSQEDGCLVIRAEHLEGEIRTTDVIELIDTTHFRWLGRADHVINSGGIKVHPEKIEKAIAPFIRTPYVILGEPDPLLGEVVVLFITDAAPTMVVAEYTMRFREVLNKYEVPKRIYFVDHLFQTGTGKIIRDRTLYPK